jgi:hypothetical protein
MSVGGEALRKRLVPYFGEWLLPVHLVSQYLTPAVPIVPLVTYASTALNSSPASAAASASASSASASAEAIVQPPVGLPVRFSVMCWNVLIDAAPGMNGVSNDTGRLQRIAEHIAQMNADVVLLQEVASSLLFCCCDQHPYALHVFTGDRHLA